MKKKILSIVLVLGMMLSLLSVTPVSASDTSAANTLPYFFNDFEDEATLATGNDVNIVDGGVGGSGKCLQITDENAWVSGAGGYKDRPIRDKNGNKFVGDIAGGSTVVISFYIKIPQELTNGNVLFWIDTNDDNKYPIAKFDKTNTEDWQKVTVSEVMKDTATKIEELKFRFGSHGDSTDLVAGDTTKALPRDFYIDDFEIAVYKKGLIKTDSVSNLHNYYMGFETGIGSIGMYTGDGYKNARETAINSCHTIQIVNNPAGSGKVLKYDMDNNRAADDTRLMIAGNKNTGQYDALYSPAGTIPTGCTLTLTFKYYLAQEMATENSPGFSAGFIDNTYVLSGTSFETSANEWHTATLSYTNNTDSDITGNQRAFWIRATSNYHSNNNTWKNASITDGTTYGDRTFYFDDFEMKITPNSDEPAAVAPITANLQLLEGEIAEGNTATFAQNFMSGDGVATDDSIVKLINTDENGNIGTLAYCSIDGDMTIPELPESGTLSFSVVPIDSSGVVGEVVSYSFVDVVGLIAEIESLEFANDGSATAKINIQNRKHDGSDINAVLVLVLYDEYGALVDYVEKAVVCENGDDILSSDTLKGQLKFTPNAENDAHSEIEFAEAYLWDCGAETSPSFKNTTMIEIAPDKSATK